MSQKRKGFTLVELLVVIAILAILATVSVVGYLAFTEKAKESNDISLTTQMNTVLQANEAQDKAESIEDVVSQLKEAGLDIEKLTPTSSGYSYVWDSSSNRVLLLDDSNNVVAPEGMTLPADKEDVVAFAKTQEDINNLSALDYSLYVPSNTTLTSVSINDLTNITIASDSSVKTMSISDTSANGEYDISADLSELTINAENATINQYGNVNTLNATAVANHSLNIYGFVATLTLTKGNLIVTGVVTTLDVSKPSATVTVNRDTNGTIGAIVTANGDLTNNANVTIEGVDSENTDVVTDAAINSDFAGGVGTKNSPYLIENVNEFKNIFSGTKDACLYFNIIQDLDFRNQNFDENYVLPGKTEYVSIDGLSHNLYAPTISDGPMFFFETIENSLISEINIYYNGWSTISNFQGNVTLNNISTYGLFEPQYQGFGTLSYQAYGIAKAIDCNNYATIKSNYNLTSVFFGYVDNTKNGNTEFIYENCSNYGTCVGAQVSLFVGNPVGQYNLTITNCKNYGVLTSTNANSTWTEIIANLSNNCKRITVDGNNWRINATNTSSYVDNYFGGCTSKIDNKFSIDKTNNQELILTQASDPSVSYYRVVISKYFKWIDTKESSGTRLISVSIKVSNSDFINNSYQTTDFKLYDFTTDDTLKSTGLKVDGNLNSSYKFVENSINIVTDGTKNYFYIDSNSMNDAVLIMSNPVYDSCYAEAYDSSNNLLYVTQLNS